MTGGLHHDPGWPRASEWLVGGGTGPSLLAVGDLGSNVSISPGHCDEAPAAIRKALARLSTYDIETGLSLEPVGVLDAGDLDPGRLGPVTGLEAVVARWCEALAPCTAGVLLGGDDAATRPAVHALARAAGVGLGRVGLVTLDAHLDMRETGSGLHNGNVVRALLEDGLPGANVAQIGIAAFANSREYAQCARSAGVSVVTRAEVAEQGAAVVFLRALARLEPDVEAIHFGLDLDVLDRSLAPGCPGSRPGGLGVHEVRACVQAAASHHLVRTMALVELDPRLDEGDRTALAAAQFLCTFAAGLQARP